MRAIARFTVFTLGVRPLSGQYAAQVAITGGTHAGRYEMRRPSCAIDGRGRVSLTDTSTAGHANRLANLVVASSSFALEFGRDTAVRVTHVGFAAAIAPRITGPGSLRLDWVYGNVTFRAQFTGAALDGADSVHVVATIGCKDVKRIP